MRAASRLLPLTLAICQLTAALASAQYRSDHFTTSNALPQNTVAAITQTRDGYLWFATYDGLVRYDGVRFTIFDRGTSAGLDSNQFLTLCEDAGGSLWAGTVDRGVVRFRRGVFATFGTSDGLQSNNVGKILCAPGGLLVPVNDTQWVRWAPGTAATAASEAVLAEFTGASGTRWRLTEGALTRRDGDGGSTQSAPIALTADDFVRHRFEDRKGALWMGSRAHGVFRSDASGLRHFTEADGVPSAEWLRIAGEDHDGNVWVYSPDRLYRFHDGRFNSYGREDGIVTQSIRSALADREGVVWVGTNDNGLYRLTPQFLTVYAEPLAGRGVYPVLQDRSGAIWIGAGTGVTKFADGVFTSFHLVSEAQGDRERLAVAAPGDARPIAPIRALYEGRDGRMWLGLAQGLVSLEDRTLTNYSALVEDGSVNAIIEDRAGDLWVATSKGLARIRGDQATWYRSADGMPDVQVDVVLQDRQGAIWAGTRAGLARIDGGRLTTITTKDGLVGDRVRTLYEDGDGVLWVGTFDSGLSRLKDGRITNYTTRNGLFNNGVFHILEDARGYFWISCNRGIYRVSRRQLNDVAEGRLAVVSSVAYGTEDGMLSAECNGGRQPAGARADDGRLWFPTSNGVVVIDPAAVQVNTQPPLVTIESVVVDRDGVDVANALRMRPGQTDLEIAYSAPSTIKAEHMLFKYRLSGLSDEWIDAGTRRSVHYSHLPPGRYVFTVIAANSDGVWSERGATIAIDKQPYFYQTRTFLVLGVAALIAMTAGAYTVRLRRLREHERELSRLVAERTAELKEANERLHQLATHDGLTGIANHRRFREFLLQEWQRAQRTKSPLSLLLVDVDYFKRYNDAYGHQRGDECLRAVAAVLSENVQRSTDLAARYGGEEFAVVLTDTNADGAFTVAEGIRQRVAALQIPHRESSAADHVTVSIGVATAPADRGDPDDLIAAADRLLYRAKEQGRNRAIRGAWPAVV